MSKRKEYPEELELAVIEYYLMPNSLYNCAKKFGISNKCQVKSILIDSLKMIMMKVLLLMIKKGD